MVDFKFFLGDFNTTQTQFRAVSENGLKWCQNNMGYAAVGATMTKTSGVDLFYRLQNEGFNVSEVESGWEV